MKLILCFGTFADFVAELDSCLKPSRFRRHKHIIDLESEDGDSRQFIDILLILLNLCVWVVVPLDSSPCVFCALCLFYCMIASCDSCC